jgi:hypothetical protein
VTEGNGAAPTQLDAVHTARTFVEAVVWGEHSRVWELFGIEARTTVLQLAAKRGMDEALAARLRDGTASDSEREDFLADLINGLRADLAGTNFDVLEYELDPVSPGPGQARVVVNVPVAPLLGGPLPVASVELSMEDGDWKVARMVPQVSK